MAARIITAREARVYKFGDPAKNRYRSVTGQAGDVVQYGDNYYILDNKRFLTSTRTDKHGVVLQNGASIRKNEPKDYVEAGYTGRPQPPPTAQQASSGVTTGINSRFNPTNQQTIGINKKSTSTPGLRSGVYTGNKGEQVIVKEGKKATTTKELLDALPKNTNDPRFQYQGPTSTVYLDADPFNQASTPGTHYSITNIPTPETREAYLARTGAANYQTTDKKIFNVQYQQQKNDRRTNTGETRRSSSTVTSVLARSGIGATETQTKARRAIIKGYFQAREKLRKNKNVIEVENTFSDIYQENVNTIDRTEAKISSLHLPQVFDPLAPTRPVLLKTFTAYPAKVIAGGIKDVRENPEIAPVAYSAAKVASPVLEGVTQVTSRYAVSTASSPLLLRTSSAGLAKGLQAVPYVAAGGVAADTILQLAPKSETERLEYLGGAIVVAGSFAAGDLSARGQGTQLVNKIAVKVTGATKEPITSLAEPKIVQYQATQGTAGQKYSTLERAGDLTANKQAFLTAQENGEIVTLHATPVDFAPTTQVARGTSKQAGLYVAPKGFAQLPFLGIRSEEAATIGIARSGRPNIVQVQGVNTYSEELIPLFKADGPGAAIKSDTYLRTQGSPKKVYLEARTFYGETPEIQGVIAEGTTLTQTGLKTPFQKFFGFSKYTTLPDGTIIPVKTYQTSKALTPVNPKPVPVIREPANSYRYQTTYDPYRAPFTTLSITPPSNVPAAPSASTSITVTAISPLPSPTSNVSKSIPPISSVTPRPSNVPSAPSSNPRPSTPSSTSAAPSSNPRPSTPSSTSAAPSSNPRPPYTIPSGIIRPRKEAILSPKKQEPRDDLFDVEVRRGGIFQTFSTQGLRLDEAVQLANVAVDTSAAASFRIVEHGSRKPITDLTLEKASTLLPQERYRRSKKDTKIFVEKNTFRINTAGEKAQIKPKRGIFSTTAVGRTTLWA